MLTDDLNIGKQPPSSRMNKINEIFHRELAKAISSECKDPRLGMVTITKVDTSKDLSVAKVFVSVLEEDKTKESVEVLNKASGFLRTKLSQSVKIRRIPSLKFIYDDSVSVGNKINSIFTGIDNNSKDNN